MLDWAWADERLAASRNYWIVTADADGRPRAAPVWGVWFDDAVVFGTSPASRKARNLARDPRVVINLESGDEVVILEGEVEHDRDDRGDRRRLLREVRLAPDVGETRRLVPAQAADGVRLARGRLSEVRDALRLLGGL